MHFTKMLTAFGVLFLMVACQKETPEENYYHISYRSQLWSMLTNAQWNIDFVGTQFDEGRYPKRISRSFDRDHQGISGITTIGVLNNLEAVMQRTETPDAVLLGIGINDIFTGNTAEETVANIYTIIAVIRSYNPNVAIFVEQVAPTTYSSDIATELDELQRMNTLIGKLALALDQPEAPVVAVDMHTGWKENYFIDNIHYNALGSIVVANRYFESMQAYLNPEKPIKILLMGDSRVEGNRPEML